MPKPPTHALYWSPENKCSLLYTFVLDYLREEIFTNLSEDLQGFLLKTSWLNTVKIHVQSLYRKLNIHSRVEASEVARRLSWL